MNKKGVRIISIILAVILSVSLFAGCTAKKPAQDAGVGSSAPALKEGVITENPITLTYWAPMNSGAAAVAKNLNDVEMYKELEKRTKVHIEFQHPPTNGQDEQFKVMIASRDLPDLIENGWPSKYPGGVAKAVEDKIIIKLNDLYEKNCPNLKKMFEKYPEAKKQTLADDGSLYIFSAYYLQQQKVFQGLMLRKDWMDELGLQLPETIDDWEKVLREFKTKKNVKAPYTITPWAQVVFTQNAFLRAYGIDTQFFVDNGKIKYGPIEAGYKDFLTLFSRWYKDGLLDSEFATCNSKTQEAMVTSNQTGAYQGAIGGFMGKFLDTMPAKNPKFNIVPVQYPVIKKGDLPKITDRKWEYNPNTSVAITTANKYPVESARWCDYAYGDEGHLLYNFGIEGLTYKMENGVPKYTDLIMKNPEKLSVSSALCKYTRASYPSLGSQDDNYMEQYYLHPQQKEAGKLWAKYADTTAKYLLPPITPTAKEAEDLSTIVNEITTYMDEMSLKFVLGVEPLSNFDKFVARIKDMGIDKAIKINQDALERYNKRK